MRHVGRFCPAGRGGALCQARPGRSGGARRRGRGVRAASSLGAGLGRELCPRRGGAARRAWRDDAQLWDRERGHGDSRRPGPPPAGAGDGGGDPRENGGRAGAVLCRRAPARAREAMRRGRSRSGNTEQHPRGGVSQGDFRAESGYPAACDPASRQRARRRGRGEHTLGLRDPKSSLARRERRPFHGRGHARGARAGYGAGARHSVARGARNGDPLAPAHAAARGFPCPSGRLRRSGRAAFPRRGRGADARRRLCRREEQAPCHVPRAPRVLLRCSWHHRRHGSRHPALCPSACGKRKGTRNARRTEGDEQDPDRDQARLRARAGGEERGDLFTRRGRA